MSIYYIKILTCKVKADELNYVLTIATDLGEQTLPYDCHVQVDILYDDVRLGQNLHWRATDVCIKGSHTFRRKTSLAKYALTFSSASDTHQSGLFENCYRDFTGSSSRVIGCTTTTEGIYEHCLKRKFKELSIFESTQNSIIAHIWDAGLALSCLVTSEQAHPFSHSIHEAFRRSRRVIELGTGTGLLGLAISRAYPHLEFQVTDLEAARGLVQQNIDINALDVSFSALDWTSPPLLPEIFDLVVMADVSYNEDYHAALLNTISTLKSSETIILMASKYRHRNERAFIDSLKDQYSTLSSITLRDLHEMPHPEIGDIEVFLFR